MNNKLTSVTSLALAMLTGFAFTSCLEGDENDNEYLIQGYFTTDGSLGNVVLHQDGGGTVYPNLSNIKDVSNFLKNERYILQLKYRVGNVNEANNSVTDAEIIGAELIDVVNPMSVALARDSSYLVLSEDSLFNMRKLSGFWAYRGYLNTIVNADYSVITVDGKVTYPFPSFNIVYDPAEIASGPADHIRLRLCYNRHTAKSAGTASQPYDFTTSFRLSQLPPIPGNDSVSITLEGSGIGSQTIKVARKDFQRGNY